MLSGYRRALVCTAAAAKQLLTTVALCCPNSKDKSSWKPPAGHPTDIHVYNSLTRSKEPLVLARPGVVTWYSCGPTVYDHAHLGHACSYVRVDIIRRILSNVFDKDVVMAMVITDIDDKIIRKANELNISSDSLARTYEQDFKQDMAALQVLHPTVYMRVTDNIPHIISFVERIIKNGHGYATETGNVYFDIQSIGDKYGKFSGFHAAEDETDQSDKRHSRDFALWKASKPQEPFWCSPWGKGRPGWHIECSTIASAIFGNQLDIHSGGIDLAFPHHENEIAQCEAYHQCEQWGNYFLHTGHLHMKGDEEKMSKSLKNYITIKQFLKTFSANQFRMFCLGCKYRSAVDFSVDSMRDAKHTLQTISSFIHDASAYMKGQITCPAIAEDILWEKLSSTKENVWAAFTDDFDTAKAVDLVMDLIHHGNKQLRAVSKETVGCTRSPVVYGAMISYITQFFSTLGISVAAKQIIDEDKSSSTLCKVMDELIDFRSKVRNYALATSQGPSSEHTEVPEEDKLLQKEKRRQLLCEREPLIHACDTMRQDLSAFGIKLKDRGDKTTWEYLESDEKL